MERSIRQIVIGCARRPHGGDQPKSTSTLPADRMSGNPGTRRVETVHGTVIVVAVVPVWVVDTLSRMFPAKAAAPTE